MKIWRRVNAILRSAECDYTSSTAQGRGGSFKDRKPIGAVACCESWMAERTSDGSKGGWRVEVLGYLSPSLSISWSFLVTFPVGVFLADSHQVPLHDLSSQIHVPATSRVYCPGSGVGDDHDGVILYNPSVYGGEWLISIGFEPVRMMENCNISGLVIRVR